MIGMRYWPISADSSFAPTFSEHLEFPPNNTIGQITVSSYHDETDPNDSHAGFDNLEFIDENNIQRSRSLPSAAGFSQNSLVRADFSGFAGNGAATFMVNLFFWEVSVF
jgi:hypothetical protein